MQISERKIGAVIILDREGEVLLGPRSQIRIAVEKMLSRGETRILLNYEGMQGWDDRHLVELVILANQVFAGGAILKLLKPSNELVKAIEHAKEQARKRKVHLVQPLDEMLESFSDEAEAVASFNS